MPSRSSEFQSNLSVQDNRRLLLDAIQSLYPKVWDDLRELVLPKLTLVVLSDRSIRSGINHPDLDPIRPAFTDWTRRYHIESSHWLHDVALRSIRGWEEHPALKGPVGLHTAESTYDVHFSWDPFVETAAAFLNRVHQKVREVRRSRQKARLPLAREYAEWLVLYQFAGFSQADIQRFEEKRGRTVGLDSIRKGWVEAATRLDIEPRKQTIGRPRKKPEDLSR